MSCHLSQVTNFDWVNEFSLQTTVDIAPEEIKLIFNATCEIPGDMYKMAAKRGSISTMTRGY